MYDEYRKSLKQLFSISGFVHELMNIPTKELSFLPLSLLQIPSGKDVSLLHEKPKDFFKKLEVQTLNLIDDYFDMLKYDMLEGKEYKEQNPQKDNKEIIPINDF